MKTEKKPSTEEITGLLDQWREADKEGRGFLIVMTDEKTDTVTCNVNMAAPYLQATINRMKAVLQEARKAAADRTMNHAKKMMS